MNFQHEDKEENPFPEDDTYQDKEESSIYSKNYSKNINIVLLNEGKLERISKKQTF